MTRRDLDSDDKTIKQRPQQGFPSHKPESVVPKGEVRFSHIACQYSNTRPISTVTLPNGLVLIYGDHDRQESAAGRLLQVFVLLFILPIRLIQRLEFVQNPART